MITFVTALLSGTAVGVLLGLTGGGAGVFAIPLLTLLMGFSFIEAKPIALIAVAIAAFVGALQSARSGHLRWRAALFVALIGSLVSPLGQWIAFHLSHQWLVYSFSILMLVMASGLFRQALAMVGSRGADNDSIQRPCMLSERTGRLIWTKRCASKLTAAGISSGVFLGLYGVGVGFILVPALSRSTNISVQATTATSLMVIALMSSIVAGGMLIDGVTINQTGLTFIGAACVGTVIGRLLSLRLSPMTLKCGLGTLMVITAILFALMS
ncbi:sulfite exporter TauE/SafE family protein [Methylobacillus sp. Pita1]|uniref:sulfite exporter TauE/SafE family protein n=1 Tax=Methylobacillus sp. Pita1 TaxID=3382642 RepID=UPI0038B5EC25